MNDLQLSLTRLIGKKELTFGCLTYRNRLSRIISKDYPQWELSEPWNLRYICIDDWENIYTSWLTDTEIIGHPATLTDLHRWMNKNNIWEDYFEQDCDFIRYNGIEFQYISSKDLLDQDEETLKQIISIINQ